MNNKPGFGKWIRNKKRLWTNEKYPDIFIEYNKQIKKFSVFNTDLLNDLREFNNNEFGKAVRYAETLLETKELSRDFGKLPNSRMKQFHDVNSKFS